MQSSLTDPGGSLAPHAELQLQYFVWLLNRRPEGPIPECSVSPSLDVPDDRDLVLRVMAAYKLSAGAFQPSASFWDTALVELKGEIHQALQGTDLNTATNILRLPASSTFFWGFDAVASSPSGAIEPHELVLRRLSAATDWRVLYALWVRDALISLSEAIGSRRVAYPETEMGQPGTPEHSVDEILDEIEAGLGREIRFPNPYPNEFGVTSKRGVIGFRSAQAVYQAWRIWQLSEGNPDFKVLEIGAGLGRTAYFASLLGIKNYTIVDIPLTSAAQGYFLGRVLGPDQVHLYGETGSAPLKLLPPAALVDGQAFDLVVNVDSWTEMAPYVAKSYWDYARRVSHMVLSINHEFNPHTVRDLYAPDRAVRALRFPYCMRRGYVEEILTWK